MEGGRKRGRGEERERGKERKVVREIEKDLKTEKERIICVHLVYTVYI